MKSKPIFLAPTGLAPETLQEIREAGYLPICTDEPERFSLILPSTVQINGDDLMMSALSAIQGSQSSIERGRFTEELWRRLSLRERALNQKPSTPNQTCPLPTADATKP